MKYNTASVIALVGVANALPRPQFSLPGLGGGDSSSGGLGSLLGGLGGSSGGGLPSLPLPTDLLGGLGGGSGGLGGLLGGGGSGGGLSSLPLPTGLLGGLGGGSGGLGGLLPGGSSSGSSGSSSGSSGSSNSSGSAGGSSSDSGLGGLLSGGGLSGGSGLGGLLGGGSSGGSGLGGLLGGLGGSSNVVVTATPTAGEATPTSTGSSGNSAGGNANNGASCASGSGGSENGVKGGKCCTDMTVIFARGTGEPGNMGIISGPPMVKAIRSKLGADKVTVQGVDYAASAMGNANMGADGGKVMAELVQQALKQCPGTKIIVSGYSQGGMVVHNAFQNGVSASNVAGAIMFGDPFKRQALPGLSTDKVKQFCGTSDTICGGGGDGGATGSHLSYGSVADSAASFAIQAAGLA